MPKFSDEALTALKRHLWPGNIRELKNVIERAHILFSGEEVTKNNVFENLLRLKVPTSEEEQNALWDATQNLDMEDEENNDKKAPRLFHTLNTMQIGLIFLMILI